ncbi:MAG: SDR family oxidoreductase [Pseudomonadota bacterium]
MDFLTDPFLIDADRFDGPVLVTGAGGCIGAWVVAILARSGVPVIASDLTPSPARAGLILGQEAAAALDWVSLDVTDGAAVTALVAERGVRAVIHLAGLQVPFCAANPALGARVNVEGTINIFDAARAAELTRLVYASSVAALAFPAGGPYRETLYGAYKMANEQSAFVYWQDWQLPSVGLRPNVVYGIARDQGMSSKNTAAIQAAARGEAFEMPFTGAYSWLYAGEAAAAFIAAASVPGSGAEVFNMNGACAPLEHGLGLLADLAPDANITLTGEPFPFPPDLDDGPLRAHLPDYPSISVEEGVRATFRAFQELQG